VRRELPRWGGQRLWRRIVGAMFTALSDPARGLAQRRGALQRAGWVLGDWRLIKTRLADVETRMIEVLDELGYTELLTSIPGISAVAAATKAAQDRGLSNATFVQDDITSFTGFDDNR
jgi:hypothetical protein